jgi:hypothetical protein
VDPSLGIQRWDRNVEHSSHGPAERLSRDALDRSLRSEKGCETGSCQRGMAVSSRENGASSAMVVSCRRSACYDGDL